MLRLNTIKAHPGAHRNTRRLGRGQGSGLGATAGKGDKGQLARTGGVSRAGFEGGQTPLYRRIPKRGFKNPTRRSAIVLNLQDLASFKGKEVSMETATANNALVKGRFERLHVLGTGEVKGAFHVKAHKVSASAKEKIEKAGGTVEILPIRKYVRKKEKSKK